MVANTFRPLATPCTIPEKSVQFAIVGPRKSNEFFDGWESVRGRRGRTRRLTRRVVGP